jgi:hypothetical protein
MSKGKIKLFYDKNTGEYNIVFEMEQDTMNLKVHNEKHNEFVRDMVGDSVEVQKDDIGKKENQSLENRENNNKKKIKQG